MTLRRFSLFSLLVLGLTACTRESDKGSSSREIKFTAVVEKSTDTGFENGDAISLFAGAPVDAVNVRLAYNNGALTPERPICWGESQTSITRFDAVYPYDGTYEYASGFIFTVKSDQSTKEGFCSSDFMTATTSAGPGNGIVALHFSHKLSTLALNVTNNSGSAISSITVSGVKLSYDTAAKTATGNSGAILAYPDGGGKTYKVIFPPQTASPVVVVKLSDGSTASYTLATASQTFTEGCRNSADISVGDPSSKKTTRPWFEMPAITDSDGNRIDDNNPSYYYAYHSFSSGSKQIRNYTVCFNIEHHCPMWVAAPRHDYYEQKKTSRSDAYKVDPDIPSQYQYNKKDTGGGCNKGHMLGSEERLCSADANRQVFYYSNIAPQYSSGFNTGGGGWNILEDFIDAQVCRDTLYEVIGCYFEEFRDGYGCSASPKKISFGGRSDVSCPTMFYYAVLRTKNGNTGKSVKNCRADELQCVAFVRAHSNELKGQKVSAKEMMSIADLEKLTGFTYFVNVPNAPKTTFNSNDWL